MMGCQAVGLLIGMEDVLPEKQSEYLSALLKPLCQQVRNPQFYSFLNISFLLVTVYVTN